MLTELIDKSYRGMQGCVNRVCVIEDGVRKRERSPKASGEERSCLQDFLVLVHGVSMLLSCGFAVSSASREMQLLARSALPAVEPNVCERERCSTSVDTTAAAGLLANVILDPRAQHPQ